MKCSTCGSDTKVIITQDVQGIRRPPDSYDQIILIRRRRVCLRVPEHRVWTIEVLQENWEKALGRRIEIEDL